MSHFNLTDKRLKETAANFSRQAAIKLGSDALKDRVMDWKAELVQLYKELLMTMMQIKGPCYMI